MYFFMPILVLINLQKNKLFYEVPRICCIVVFLAVLSGCQQQRNTATENEAKVDKLTLDSEMAALIFALPTHCLTIEYPNKMGQVLGSVQDLKGPKALRPIFYGCFDWHSSVHGYWSIVHLLRLHPDLDSDGKIRQILNAHITKENLAVELAFFFKIKII